MEKMKPGWRERRRDQRPVVVADWIVYRLVPSLKRRMSRPCASTPQLNTNCLKEATAFMLASNPLIHMYSFSQSLTGLEPHTSRPGPLLSQ